MNEGLCLLDALVQLAVVSGSMSAEPGSPSDGALYIVPAGKSGAHWSGYANWSLAYYIDGAWRQITPREGFVAYVRDVDIVYVYTGSAWAPLNICRDSTDTWTYTTATLRAANNSNSNRMGFLCGLAEGAFTACFSSRRSVAVADGPHAVARDVSR